MHRYDGDLFTVENRISLLQVFRFLQQINQEFIYEVHEISFIA